MRATLFKEIPDKLHAAFQLITLFGCWRIKKMPSNGHFCPKLRGITFFHIAFDYLSVMFFQFFNLGRSSLLWVWLTQGRMLIALEHLLLSLPKKTRNKIYIVTLNCLEVSQHFLDFTDWIIQNNSFSGLQFPPLFDNSRRLHVCIFYGWCCLLTHLFQWPHFERSPSDGFHSNCSPSRYTFWQRCYLST